MQDNQDIDVLLLILPGTMIRMIPASSHTQYSLVTELPQLISHLSSSVLISPFLFIDLPPRLHLSEIRGFAGEALLQRVER